MKKLFLSALALMTVFTVVGKTPELIPTSQEKRSFKITPGVIENSYSFQLPPVAPRKGYGVVLRFDGRVATPGVGGWNPYIGIELNGTVVGKLTKDSTPRLLFRGFTMKATNVEKDWWNSQGEKSNLMVFFAPESATELDARVLNAREQKYVYTLDVTDLVNYVTLGADDRIEGNVPNEFTFYDRLSSNYTKVPMVIKDAQLFYMKIEDIRKAAGVTMTKFVPAATAAAELECNGSTVKVMPNGGISVTRDGETFFIESNFSYIAKPQLKYNRFNVDAKKAGDKSWQVKVTQSSPDTVKVYGSFKDYTVSRTMSVKDHRINVQDVYLNKSAQDLGILWSHIVGNNALLNPTSRMAGQTMPLLVNFFGSSNPSLYCAGSKSGVGLLAEDTVSRAQMQFKTIGNIQSMGSIGMGLPAGKSHTLDWAIYPLAKGDYYDFINQVRRDWKVNYTLEGPYGGHDYKEVFPKAAIKPVAGFHRFDYGGRLTDEQYRIEALKDIDFLRKTAPDIKLLGMIETNLVAFDCSKVPWGNKFIQRPNSSAASRKGPGIKYGQVMSPELTKKMIEYSPYRDSMIFDEKGRGLYENFFAFKPYISIMVQLEMNNQRYKQFMEQIEFMMDKIKLDGVYIDQFQPYTNGGFSENRWDGYTVELAADGSIKRKRYSYAITGAPARAKIIKTVLDRGGIVVTNGQPMSREEQGNGVFAFQEMENDDVNPLKFMDVKPPECRWQVVSHLGSPIALGLRPRRYIGKGATAEMMAQVQTKGIITALRNSLVFYFYTVDVTDSGPKKGSLAICENMFPFTPEELHEGWIKGKERTITAISGKFPVNGKEKPQVLYFDKKGFEQANNFAITGEPGNWIVDVKLNDWNEVAIMIAR